MEKKTVKVKKYTKKATIWDNQFIELATINTTLAITATQLAKKPTTALGYEYTHFKKKRDLLEKNLLRGF